MGYDLRGEAAAVRAVIGSPGSSPRSNNWLTGEENLLLMGRLLHLPAAQRRARAAGLLERFDLVEAARRTPATYSGGMTRRLDIAMTLMGRPRLIFLDEPTAGLDPRSATHVAAHRDLVAEGVTVLLTTQYLEEADQLADRIAVLDRGPHRRRRYPAAAQTAHPPVRTSGCVSPTSLARRGRPGAARGRPRRRGAGAAGTERGGISSLRDVLARLGDGVAVEGCRSGRRTRRQVRRVDWTGRSTATPSPKAGEHVAQRGDAALVRYPQHQRLVVAGALGQRPDGRVERGDVAKRSGCAHRGCAV